MFFGISLLGIFAMRLADDIHVAPTKVIKKTMDLTYVLLKKLTPFL
jgi:hypothetical protein